MNLIHIIMTQYTTLVWIVYSILCAALRLMKTIAVIIDAMIAKIKAQTNPIIIGEAPFWETHRVFGPVIFVTFSGLPLAGAA